MHLRAFGLPARRHQAFAAASRDRGEGIALARYPFGPRCSGIGQPLLGLLNLMNNPGEAVSHNALVNAKRVEVLYDLMRGRRIQYRIEEATACE
jgi:hypothetical protein